MAYIGNQIPAGSYRKLTNISASFNGLTTNFQLSVPPGTAQYYVTPSSVNQLLISVGGVIQEPGVDFTLNGSQIVFSTAPAAGLSFFGIQMGDALNIGTPSDGTVSTAKLADGVLSADATGLAKMADGFFTVTAGALAKFADGFLAASAAGRAKMADLFVTTAKIDNQAVTPAKLSQPLTLATAQNTTSGTSIDFTGIPSWVKKVTVVFNGVSTSGASLVQIQVGSGSVTTTGYKSTSSYSANPAATFAFASTGFVLDTTYASGSLTRSGIYTLALLGSNVWCGNGCIGGDSTAQVTWACAGNSPALSGALDRVRITTVNGTDTFDAGSVNILYE